MFMVGVYRPDVENEMRNESKILKNEMKNSFEKERKKERISNELLSLCS